MRAPGTWFSTLLFLRDGSTPCLPRSLKGLQNVAFPFIKPQQLRIYHTGGNSVSPHLAFLEHH